MAVAQQQHAIVYEFDSEQTSRRTPIVSLANLDDYLTDCVPLRWQFTIGMPVLRASAMAIHHRYASIRFEKVSSSQQSRNHLKRYHRLLCRFRQ